MELPPWADEGASKRVPIWRAEGEGQRLEFKREFPPQAHNLATEIAAFATSGGGTILIGVHKNGDVAGLQAQSEDERDDLIQRAQGIARSVRPQVKCGVVLAWDGAPVLVIELPKQDEPVFYYQYRPYIRDGRESRPAEPDEVKKAIHQHPSAEHKRRMEDLQYRQSEAMVNASRMADANMQRLHDGFLKKMGYD